MANAILSLQPSFTQLQTHIEYPQTGVLSKVLLKAQTCDFTVFCLATGAEISEHTSTRHAVVQCLDGRGVLTLAGQDIPLEAGVLVVMPANTPHALRSDENLAFLLTLWAHSETATTPKA